MTDRVGRSSDSVGRTSDSVRHSMWRTGEAVRRPRLAGLGASPSVAARQLPLGGSDWIGLFGGRLQAGRLWLLDRRAPFGGGSPEWELPQAEGEAVRRPRLAGLGASPSVAARQLPLGGSDWIGLFGGRLQAGRLWLLDRRAPFGGGSPEWELPQAEAVRRPRLAGLGASPSVAARQLPLGGSDWIGLFGGDCRLADFGSRIGALRSAVAPPSGSCRRRRPCGGPGWRGWEPPPQSLRDSSPSGGAIGSGCSGGTPGWQALAPRSARSVRRWLPRVGAAAGGGRAAAQVGAVGSLPLSRCATAPPRGERLDRVVRGATAGWQTSARGSARSVRRWLPRSVAAPLCPLPAQGQASASPPAEWGERRSGRPIPGFGRPLLVADRGERGSGLFRGFLDERFAVGGRALDLCGGDHSCPAARPAMRPKTEPAMRPEPPA